MGELPFLNMSDPFFSSGSLKKEANMWRLQWYVTVALCVCVCPGHPDTAPEKVSFGVPKPTDQIPNLRRNDWMSRGALLHFKCFSSGRKKQPIFRTSVDSFWKDRKDHAAMPNPNDTLEQKNILITCDFQAWSFAATKHVQGRSQKWKKLSVTYLTP